MSTQSPFPFLDGLFERLGKGLQPPPWVVDEVQRRAALAANHVLMQEPEAQARLARHAGRTVRASWRTFWIALAITPAGLFEVVSTPARADLTLALEEESPFRLGEAAMRGEKPPVRIEGDVQLAAEINWIGDNVRWDAEEDLSRLVGDAPAHAVAGAGRRAVEALRRFAAPRTTPPAS